MQDRSFLIISGVLLLFGVPLVFFLYNTGFSVYSIALIGFFITTLIALMISLFFLRTSPGGKFHQDQTDLERRYLHKSVDEQKPQGQIIEELEGEGYRRKDIYALIHDIDPDQNNPILVH